MAGDEAAALAEEWADLAPQELLAKALEHFGDRVALATSLGAEDQVLTDMLCGLTKTPRIFSLDTGRLHQETYDALDATNRRYGIQIKVLFPDRESVEELVGKQGPNSFRESVDQRKECCRIRKVVPLKRELGTLEAWITGLRREQAVTRTALGKVEWDEGNGLIKINPLADWSEDDVWEYIRERDVPYNALHDIGFPSIGCAPCTRAVSRTEDVRAGRWWWESPEHKECGLHGRTPAQS